MAGSDALISTSRASISRASISRASASGPISPGISPSFKGGLAGTLCRKKFLEFLTDFIRAETIFSKGTESKIDIYRQVFDYFIQEFKTYSSILSQVKNEYELTISRLEEKVASLEPLKGKLAIMKLQNLQELNQQSFELDEFLVKFKTENQYLRDQHAIFTPKIQSFESEISILLKENNALKEKNHELLNMPVDISKVENSQKEELIKKEKEIEKLQDIITISNKKISNLSKDLQELMEQNEQSINPEVLNSVKNQLSDSQEKNSELKSIIQNLNEKIDELKLEKVGLIKEMASIEPERYPDWQCIQSQVPFSIREYEISLKGLCYNDVISNIILEIPKVFLRFI